MHMLRFMPGVSFFQANANSGKNASVSFNSSLGYRFKQEAPRLLRHSSIRLGVVNLADQEPPLTSGAVGFSAAVHGSLYQGRTWTIELTKQL